jgi:hypothetical protein
MEMRKRDCSKSIRAITFESAQAVKIKIPPEEAGFKISGVDVITF